MLGRFVALFQLFAFLVLSSLSPPSSAAATGTLSTDSPCTLASGGTTCTVNVNWTGSGANWFCIWPSPTQIFACSGPGTWTDKWPWVTTTAGTLTLKAHATQPQSGADYASGVTLATTTVVAQQATHAKPTITIANATTLSGLTAPASVRFTATTAASDGATVNKVEYFNGAATTPFATVASGAPFTYTWGNLAAGTYNVTAKATDSLGAVSLASNNITFTVGAGSTATGSLTTSSPCTLSGSSTTCTVKVDWTGSGANWFCVWPSPTQIFACAGPGSSTANWPWVTTTPGTLTLKAHATQPTSGADYASGITLDSKTVVAVTTTHAAPTVSISTSTALGSLTAPASVALSATTAASDGATVSKVEYFNNNAATPFATLTSGGTFAYNWTGLSAGNYSVTAKATDTLGGISVASNAITFTVNAGSASPTPYGGTAAAIPGRIEAERYDLGGENVAYHDTTSGNSGAQFRSDGVDVEPCTDTGCGYNVGYVVAGEWLKYTVNVTQSGTYAIGFRVASLYGSQLHLEVDGVNVTGLMTVPNTGGWQAWQTITKSGVSLTAGSHVLRLYADGANFNLNWIEFASSVHYPPTISISNSTSTAGLTSPASVTLNSNTTSSGGAVVNKVEYFNNNSATPFATVTTGTPFTYSWTGLGAGSYSVTAKATDDMGGVSTMSNAIAFTVAASTICSASTTAEVRNCITRVRNGLSTKIQITAMISCSAASECAFDLSGINWPYGTTPVEIYGADRSTTGFYRSAYYDYPIFSMYQTANLKIHDLTFDDTSADIRSGEGIINLFYSKSITIQNTTFRNAKFSAIAFRASDTVTVDHNTIDATQRYGIWGPDGNAPDYALEDLSRNVTITNNVFSNTWVNGILASFVNARITKNEFVHNHYKAVFGVSGGQMLIEQNSNNVFFGCNNVHDSNISGYPNSVGMEFATSHIHGVEVAGNTIINHDGYGVAINYGNEDIGEITIHNNRVYNNGLSPQTGTQYDYKDFVPAIFSNCTDTSCLTPCQ